MHCKSTRGPHLLLFCLLTCLPLSLAAQYPDQAVILQYHHVSTHTPPVTSLSPEEFKTHMTYLATNGFQIAALESVVNKLQGGESLPDRTAVITFDDAYISVYSEAFPVLKNYGWPFTVFVNSALVGSNPGLYVNWEQLREMAAAGATIANHTVSHPYLLDKDPGESEAAWLQRISDEITLAEASIARETGHDHKLLAYPYGEYNSAIQALVRKLGYIGIAQHSGPINASSDFSALPRFPFSGIYASMNTFAIKVNSLAFKLLSVSPLDPTTSALSPSAQLVFAPGGYRMQELACYNNDQRIEVQQANNTELHVTVRSPIENHKRRFRYNCTAPGAQGRYYWYSIPWINPAIAE
ncbi:MAG: polysaccharide deacetylase family protein [Pseudomonadales bacterium]|nr:polysaccharide deacetylase family protein [Pseudomonadales bacterium]